MLDSTSPVVEAREPTTLGRVGGAVGFQAVSFKYCKYASSGNSGSYGDSVQETLRNIDLEALPGQKIAVLGAPGSGKSTLVNLIPRFYDVGGGRVTIDGVDVREATLESLRRNVGIVFQDVFLFGATVRENIAYAAPDAPLDQVEAVARSAQIHDFVTGLPQQYDTLVGERGVTLSGGQRQRVAIARTLLQDPPILILDDSTSSVDAETESLIQRALEEVIRGRTTFVIAHRVSSVKTADLIVVLEDGEIVERGTHRQLISRDGPYREIYRLQLHAEDDLFAETRAGDDGG